MTEEQLAELIEEVEEEAAETGRTTTEEIKVQLDELADTLNEIVREGTAKRIKVVRNDRVLLDLPLALGLGGSMLLAIQMPVISAMVGVGALLTGCTVHVEREIVDKD